MNANREESICDSCVALDQSDYDAYMDLCSSGFSYTLSAYSPEEKQEMTWLHHDRVEIKHLFHALPKHDSDRNPLAHIAVVYRVKVDENHERSDVVSSFRIFKVALNGGHSELLAVSKYFDTVSLEGGGPALVNRHAKLDTLDLVWGYHVPF